MCIRDSLFNRVETTKLAITQLHSNAISDMVGAEAKALQSITESAKARMNNLREVEDRVQGSLLAMEEQERNTLEAVDIACKVFDDKTETFDEIRLKPKAGKSYHPACKVATRHKFVGGSSC